MAEQTAGRPCRPPAPASTVLVVDDESTVISLCKTILQEAGWTVISTDDSSDALKLCTEHQGSIDLGIQLQPIPPCPWS
jgi:CheY-like chemotaxis protein